MEDVATVCGGCDYVFGGCDYSVWEDVTTVGGCEQCVEYVTTVYGRMWLQFVEDVATCLEDVTTVCGRM